MKSEDNNDIKNTILKCLPEFNKKLKEYLKDNLATEGEDNIIDRICIHMGVYFASDQFYMSPASPPCAIRYDGTGVHELTEDIGENSIKDKAWWGRNLGQEPERLEVREKFVKNSISNEMNVNTTLVLALEAGSSELEREKLLLSVIIDVLYDSVGDDIKTIVDIGNGTKKIRSENTVSLMERYVNKVFERWNGYPGISREECINLSYKKEEDRECTGVIYIGGKKSDSYESLRREKVRIICFEDRWSRMRERGWPEKDLHKGKTKYFRKMLELCKENKCLITCFDGDEVDLFGLADEEWLKANGYEERICFEGRGEWQVKKGEEQLLFYKGGRFYYSRVSRDKAYYNEIKAKQAIEGTDEELKKFNDAVVKIADQPHGTGMIILNDAKDEAFRLCHECGRGMRIQGIDLKDKSIQGFLAGLTSVDGMLLVDRKGICYAFGVILDGQAVPGNPARGARHNSALSYIKMDEKRNAVIISENGTVEIQ